MLKQYNNPDNSNLKIMHFLPGNSFTPYAYNRMLDSLSDKFLIKNFLLRPLWDNNPMPKFNNWDIFLNDYLESINKEEKITAIGHSIGGNLLLKAAMLKSKKFDKIILLDPTFLPPYMIRAWKIISFLNIQSYFLPFINSAKNKRMQYSSINKMFESYRKNKIFSNFSDTSLYELIGSLTIKEEDRVSLIFPSDWDSRIYKTGMSNDMFIWKNIKHLNVDTTIIRADGSNVFFKKTEDLIMKKNKKINVETIESSDHLFPINNSSNTLKLIRKII